MSSESTLTCMEELNLALNVLRMLVKVVCVEIRPLSLIICATIDWRTLVGLQRINFAPTFNFNSKLQNCKRNTTQPQIIKSKAPQQKH